MPGGAAGSSDGDEPTLSGESDEETPTLSSEAEPSSETESEGKDTVISASTASTGTSPGLRDIRAGKPRVRTRTMRIQTDPQVTAVVTTSGASKQQQEEEWGRWVLNLLITWMVWGTMAAGSKCLRSLAKKQINGAVVAVLLAGFFGGGLYLGNEGEQTPASTPPPVALMSNSSVNITAFEELLRQARGADPLLSPNTSTSTHVPAQAAPPSSPSQNLFLLLERGRPDRFLNQDAVSSWRQIAQMICILSQIT